MDPEDDEILHSRTFYITFGRHHQHRRGNMTIGIDDVVGHKSTSYGKAHEWAVNTFGYNFEMLVERLPDGVDLRDVIHL